MASPNTLNFLPDGYLEQKAQRRANAICAVLFLIVMAGMWAAFTLSEQATKRVDNEFAKTEQQYLGEAKRIEQVRQMQEKQKRMAHQADLTASLLEKVPRSFLLAEITNSIPAGISLIDLAMESKERAKTPKDAPKTAYEQQKAARQAQKAAPQGPPPPPEPKLYDVSVKITGMALNDVQVAQFLKNLSNSKLLRDVNLLVSEEFSQGTDKLRKFQIDMALDRNAEVQAQAKPPTLSAALRFTN